MNAAEFNARMARLDALATAMMATRPDLPAASLDEWLMANNASLSAAEANCADAILALFDQMALT